MEEMRSLYSILVGKPGGKDNIRIDLREIRWEGVDWIHLAQDRGQDPCEYGNEPSGSIKGGEFLD
jgi:hypothetical protein